LAFSSNLFFELGFIIILFSRAAGGIFINNYPVLLFMGKAYHLLAAEGLRFFARRIRVAASGIKKYNGSPEEICRQIIEDCWNGEYFQTSAGHFNEFYIRDFGFCVDSLLRLGYRDRVMKTLAYALEKYSKAGLSTTITPSGICIDVFDYAPDSLAFLLFSLRAAKANNLVEKYRSFLKKETERLVRIVIDKKEGMVRKDRHFSSMKDSSLRRGSCYDNVMLAAISRELDFLGLDNPLKGWRRYSEMIVREFWNGNYFYDDTRKENVVYGDNAVIPFWLGVVKDEGMLRKSIESARKAGLDKPSPLKYSSQNQEKSRVNILTRHFAGNYQGNAVWMNIGPMFAQLVKKIDKKLAASYKKKHMELVRKHSNFLEVYDAKGNPFSTLFYYSDESMIWAANFLAL
jgi:hypothetical protein